MAVSVPRLSRWTIRFATSRAMPASGFTSPQSTIECAKPTSLGVQPDGLNRAGASRSTQAATGTPRCRPSETLTAKESAGPATSRRLATSGSPSALGGRAHRSLR